MKREVKLRGMVATFGSYTLLEDELIEDATTDFSGNRAKLLLGKRRNLTIFFALLSWDVKVDGKPVALPEKLLVDSAGEVVGINPAALAVFYAHFPKDAASLGAAYAAAKAGQGLTDDEKKTLQE